jgi:hypothetical protein
MPRKRAKRNPAARPSPRGSSGMGVPVHYAGGAGCGSGSGSGSGGVGGFGSSNMVTPPFLLIASRRMSSRRREGYSPASAQYYSKTKPPLAITNEGLFGAVECLHRQEEQGAGRHETENVRCASPTHPARWVLQTFTILAPTKSRRKVDSCPLPRRSSRRIPWS